VTAPDREETARLTAVADWQRGELNRLRAQAADRSVIERATGMLMERLGCPADEARQQLARLAAESAVSTADIAAEIAGESLLTGPAPARRRVSRADAAITAAPDAAALAEALLTEVLSAEGADAAAVCLLAPDGGIELAGEAGFGPREAARWRRIPPDVSSLPLRAVREDREFWWPAGAPPGDDAVLIGQRPGSARAVVPLRQRGRCFGALEMCWPSAITEFAASTRDQLSALAGPCAQALSAGLPPGTPGEGGDHDGHESPGSRAAVPVVPADRAFRLRRPGSRVVTALSFAHARPLPRRGALIRQRDGC
jgi:ANTAR domain/GAF domain